MNPIDPTPAPMPTVDPLGLPAVLRKILYVLCMIGTLTLTYLGAKGILAGPEMAYGTGLTSLVFALAAGKTQTAKAKKVKTSPADVAHGMGPGDAIPDPDADVLDDDPDDGTAGQDLEAE